MPAAPSLSWTLGALLRHHFLQAHARLLTQHLPLLLAIPIVRSRIQEAVPSAWQRTMRHSSQVLSSSALAVMSCARKRASRYSTPVLVNF
eukprot:3498413-Pleurochrysis_carterae.AAC.2